MEIDYKEWVVKLLKTYVTAHAQAFKTVYELYKNHVRDNKPFSKTQEIEFAIRINYLRFFTGFIEENYDLIVSIALDEEQLDGYDEYINTARDFLAHIEDKSKMVPFYNKPSNKQEH